MTNHESSQNHHLYRWKLSFDGRLDGIPVHRFIFRVEHEARNFGMTEIHLYNELGSLLKGHAADWYWSFLEEHPDGTWQQLKQDLLNRFQDRRTDDEIKQQLESRKQKWKEPFMEFYNDFMAITLQFHKLIPEKDILHILKQNMRSGFQVILPDYQIDTISNLVARCVALEESWKRNKFEPELLCHRRNVSELVQEVEDPRAYGYSQIQSQSAHLIDHEENINAMQRVNITPTSQFRPREFNVTANGIRDDTTYVVCWNCCDSGHTYINCPVPINKIFCFGCGRNGILKPNCFRCKSGNSNMRFQIAARPRPQETHQSIPAAPLNTDIEQRSKP